MIKPNLFVVGAARSGTTTLWDILKKHPQIYMPKDEMFKEPAFFSFKGENLGLDNYLKLFKDVKNEKYTGEASTAYLTDITSAKRIFKYNPDAKIIIIVRNPADRAYSLYNWMVQDGYEYIPSFEIALKKEKERRNKQIPNWFEPEYYHNYMYLGSGFYPGQVNMYLKLFGDNVLIIKFEEFIANLDVNLNKIYKFLNLEPLRITSDLLNKSQAVYSSQIQFILRKLTDSLYSIPNEKVNGLGIKEYIRDKYYYFENILNEHTELNENYYRYRNTVLNEITEKDFDLNEFWDSYLVKEKRDKLLKYGWRNKKVPKLDENIRNTLLELYKSSVIELSNLLKLYNITFKVDDYLSQNNSTYSVQNKINGYKKIKDDRHNNLKVVHLCTYDSGGAGKAAFRLHKGLQSIGIDSLLIVLDKVSADPSVKVIPDCELEYVANCNSQDSYFSDRMKQKWKYWSEIGRENPNKPKGVEIFTESSSTVRLDRIKEILEADIVNLHWVAGMIDYNDLPFALKDKKIVWTLHDMNAFTGGCHYSSGCNKFNSKCGFCFQLGSNTENDLSSETFDIKRRTYDKLDINGVSPSNWLGGEAASSALFSRFDIDVIPNGLPLDIFKPYPGQELRKALNIPLNKKIVLFGADGITNKRKGFALLLEALNKISDEIIHEVILGVFGDLPTNVSLKSKFDILNFGSVHSERSLAIIYSISDLFVLPSIEDNLPNTVLESLSCGTPVVAFNVGGLPEMILHKGTGYLAKPEDINDLTNGIKWALGEVNNYEIQKACRKFSEEHFDIKIQTDAYLKKYHEILNDQNDINNSNQCPTNPFSSIADLLEVEKINSKNVLLSDKVCTKKIIKFIDGIYIISNLPYQFNEEEYDKQYGYNKINQDIRKGFAKLLMENKINTSYPFLEIGAGTGVLTLPILQDNNFPLHIISDSSISFLKILQKKLNYSNISANTKFCSMKAEELELFPDKIFSVIALRYVLHHISDWKNFIGLCRRKLINGGALIFEEPLSNGFVLEAFAVQFLPVLASIDKNDLTNEENNCLLSLLNVTKFYLNKSLDKSFSEDKHAFQIEDIWQAAQESSFSCRAYPGYGIDRLVPLCKDNFMEMFLYNCRHNLSYPESFVNKVDKYLSPYAKFLQNLDENAVVSFNRGIFVLKVEE